MVVCKVTLLVLTIVLVNVSSHRIRTLAAPAEFEIPSLLAPESKSLFQRMKGDDQIRLWNGLFIDFMSRKGSSDYSRHKRPKNSETRAKDTLRPLPKLTHEHLLNIMNKWKMEFSNVHSSREQSQILQEFSGLLDEETRKKLSNN
eukprot:GHVL01014049.1.p1 GENE.GHVL01014049.1~~GHVL01014049.1.p1  ORF type:complete len:145 (+),score=13.62 GHVL01014049.1:23-457(+)